MGISTGREIALDNLTSMVNSNHLNVDKVRTITKYFGNGLILRLLRWEWYN